MHHLPAADSIQFKKQANSSTINLPLWANYSLDDKNLLFSHQLASLVAKTDQQQKQSIQEYVEEGLALALATKIQERA
jgi:hypothetical protein